MVYFDSGVQIVPRTGACPPGLVVSVKRVMVYDGREQKTRGWTSERERVRRTRDTRKSTMNDAPRTIRRMRDEEAGSERAF